MGWMVRASRNYTNGMEGVSNKEKHNVATVHAIHCAHTYTHVRVRSRFSQNPRRATRGARVRPRPRHMQTGLAFGHITREQQSQQHITEPTETETARARLGS